MRLPNRKVRRRAEKIVKSTKKKRRSKKLATLMAAALALPGLGLDAASTVEAQSMLPTPVIRLRYGEYRDEQRSGDRMRVHVPMLQLRTPVTESLELEGTVMYESMSGASPLYLSTLSGASGVSVEDNRTAGDFKLTKYFERFSLAAGASSSSEDDYKSNGFVTEARFWTADKNTVFQAAGGADFDDISSTINAEVNEERQTGNFLFGVTQVIDSVSAVQSNVTYLSGDGYFSDPYKPFDNRPRSREALAWLTRYVRYIESADASLHADYRLFHDSYGVWAHTVELAWYQPLGESWMVRPSIRYYSQSEAEFFFNGRFPTERPSGFFSADQRLSRFGEWGAGLKFMWNVSPGLTLDMSAHYFQQRSGFYLGGPGSSNIEPFSGGFLLVGFTKNF